MGRLFKLHLRSRVRASKIKSASLDRLDLKSSSSGLLPPAIDSISSAVPTMSLKGG